MKPFLYIAIFTLFTSFFPYANAQVVTYPLPDPAISGGRPLMDVISERHSSRTFSSNPIDDQTLSEVLYAAYGVSHDQGKRTIPMAKGQNTMNIYVFHIYLVMLVYFFIPKWNISILGNILILISPFLIVYILSRKRVNKVYDGIFYPVNISIDTGKISYNKYKKFKK